MKGKDIIKLIQDGNLEDFEVEFAVESPGEIFPDVKSFSIEGLADIGHSDKILVLEAKEIQKN